MNSRQWQVLSIVGRWLLAGGLVATSLAKLTATAGASDARALPDWALLLAACWEMVLAFSLAIDRRWALAAVLISCGVSIAIAAVARPEACGCLGPLNFTWRGMMVTAGLAGAFTVFLLEAQRRALPSDATARQSQA